MTLSGLSTLTGLTPWQTCQRTKLLTVNKRLYKTKLTPMRPIGKSHSFRAFLCFWGGFILWCEKKFVPKIPIVRLKPMGSLIKKNHPTPYRITLPERDYTPAFFLPLFLFIGTNSILTLCQLYTYAIFSKKNIEYV